MMFAAAYPLAEQLARIAASVGGILPEWVLVATFLLAIVAEIWPGKAMRPAVPWIAIAGTGVAGALVLLQVLAPVGAPVEEGFLGMIVPDRYAAWFKLIMVAPALLTYWASMQSRKLMTQSAGTGEYYLMLLAMLVGLFFLTMAQHLLLLFLALEMISLPSYVLTAYTRLQKKSAEASLKYVIYGSFSSGVMLYGLSWLYGMTGTLNPSDPAFAVGLAAAPAWTQTFVWVLILAGLSFKIGFLPFHFWVPDVYEAAPYPVAAFFSVAPKAAGFAALIRLMSAMPVDAVPGLGDRLAVLLGVLALGSMFLGNLSALKQQNFRRMLGYSAIAHAGYMLAGVACMSVAGSTAVVFYLTIYTLMNYGAFLVAGWMNEHLGTEHTDDLKGLAGVMPLLAVILSVLMVALTGLPPTAGFIAKLQLFFAATGGLGQGRDLLLILLMGGILLNTVISLFYYLRPPVMMVFKNPSFKTNPALHGWLKYMLCILAILIVWLGIISFDALINFMNGFVAEMNG